MLDSSTAPWAILLLRLSLAALFVAHAMLKKGWLFSNKDGGWEACQ